MTDFAVKAAEQRSYLEGLIDSYLYGLNDSGTPVQPWIRQIIVDALACGYKPFTMGTAPLSNPFMLQRRIRDERGTLYFVDLAFWDMAREFEQHDKRFGVTIAPSGQFYLGERHGPSERPVNVSAFTVRGETLKSIEEFFAKFYTAMGCVPYEAAE